MNIFFNLSEKPSVHVLQCIFLQTFCQKKKNLLKY